MGMTNFEKRIMNNINNGVSFGYSVYVFLYKERQMVEKLRSNFSKLLDEYPMLDCTTFKKIQESKYADLSFSIKVLDAYSSGAREAFVYSAIDTASKNIYAPGESDLVRIQVFQTEENRYICVAQICDAVELVLSKRVILSALDLRVSNYPSESSISSTYYYKKTYADAMPSISLDKIMPEQDFEREIFELTPVFANFMENASEADIIGVKNIIMSIWGIVLSKSFNMSEIVSAEILMQDKLLTMAFIKQDNTLQLKDILANNLTYRMESIENSDCTVSDIEKILDKKIHEVVSVVHNFIYKKRDESILNSLEKGDVYKMPDGLNKAVALNIDYNISKDCPRITYTYDKEVFKTLNIESLHETVMNTLREIFNKAYGVDIKNVVIEKANIPEVIKEENANNFRLHKLMRTVIDSNKMFSSLTSDEKDYLVDASRLVSYSVGENIIMPNISYHKLLLVVSGKVSNERLDKNSTIQPLILIKENEMFGFESLLSRGWSSDIYTVPTDKAVVMEISVSVIKELYAKHPEILIDILEIYENRLDKFKRLWMMN